MSPNAGESGGVESNVIFCAVGLVPGPEVGLPGPSVGPPVVPPLGPLEGSPPGPVFGSVDGSVDGSTVGSPVAPLCGSAVGSDDVGTEAVAGGTLAVAEPVASPPAGLVPRPSGLPVPVPGPEPPGRPEEATLWSGRSTSPVLSEAGFASMLWAPT